MTGPSDRPPDRAPDRPPDRPPDRAPDRAQVEKLEDPVLPVTEIVAKCPAPQLMALYKVSSRV